MKEKLNELDISINKNHKEIDTLYKQILNLANKNSDLKREKISLEKQLGIGRKFRTMRIVDSFVEDKKNEFLKGIAPIEKLYDYYLGLVFTKIKDEGCLKNGCKEIHDKSEKNIRLLKSFELDDKVLVLFEIKSKFVKNKLNGVLMSISKYLSVEEYTVTYMNTLHNMIFDSWEEQYYFRLKDGEKEYDLRILRE